MYVAAEIEIFQNKFHVNHTMFKSQLKDFKTRVEEDIKQLNHTGTIKFALNGYFVYIGQETYVYQHSEHVSFSSIKLSHIEFLWSVTMEQIDEKLLFAKCDKHKYHDSLMPYFMDNRHLKVHIDQKLSQGGLDSSRHDLLAEYKQKLEQGDDLFYEPCDLTNNWNENDWTLRLFRCLKATFPDLNPRYTANRALEFPRLQYDMVPLNGIEKSFIFRGAPDILITKSSAVVCAHGRTHGEDTDEEVSVEHCHQKPPIKGCSTGELPEKMGELIASLHFLLVCKVLRRISRENISVSKAFESLAVYGLLLDKAIGCVHCKMAGKMALSDSKLFISVHIRNTIGECLTPNSLCYHFSSMLTW